MAQKYSGIKNILKSFGGRSGRHAEDVITIEEQQDEEDSGEKTAEKTKQIKEEPRDNEEYDDLSRHSEIGELEREEIDVRNNNQSRERLDEQRPEPVQLKQLGSLQMDAAVMLADRTFELDDFSQPTIFRSTELRFSGGRTFYVSLDYLSEISEFFRALNDGKRKGLFTFDDEDADAFLTFLRAVTPCPMQQPVDEFNICSLTELSLQYAAWQLYAKCEQWLCANMKQLMDDEIVSALKAVYRRRSEERTFLCEQLIEFVAENFTFDQLDKFTAVDEQLSLLLYQRSSRALAKRNNDLTQKLAMVKNNPAMIADLEIVEVRPGRKRVIEQNGQAGDGDAAAADGSPAPKRTKLETVVICPRCADDKRKQNPRHNLSLVNLKCALCQRFRCTASCSRESTCKDGKGCLIASSSPITLSTSAAASRTVSPAQLARSPAQSQFTRSPVMQTIQGVQLPTTRYTTSANRAKAANQSAKKLSVSTSCLSQPGLGTQFAAQALHRPGQSSPFNSQLLLPPSHIRPTPPSQSMQNLSKQPPSAPR